MAAATGERVLSATAVQMLCKGRFRGLNLSPAETDPITGQPEPHSQHGGLARAFGMAGAASDFPRSFNFGWATSHGFVSGWHLLLLVLLLAAAAAAADGAYDVLRCSRKAS